MGRVEEPEFNLSALGNSKWFNLQQKDHHSFQIYTVGVVNIISYNER